MSAASRTEIAPGELEESAEEFYEHAPCGYVSTLPDGLIVRANATFAGWMRTPRAELVNLRRLQELFTTAGRIYHETHLAPLLRMQGFVNEIALELAPGAGAPIPVLVSCVQKRDEAGEPLFNRFTIFNATERRKYERELLAERRRAERADAAKADLLSMIAHDMRTPLTAITGAVQLLDRLSPAPRQAKYLRILRSSATALIGLATQILDYSRLESHATRVDAAPFDVRALVRDTVDELIARAEEKGVALAHHVDAAVPAEIVGDAAKVRQILANLTGNAVKFTERGWVSIAVRSGPDGELFIEVRDTGIGIPAERLEAIFEEFTQAGPEIGRRYGGTGLGLTIVRRLVQLLGGEIRVASLPGEGSTFSVSLPALKRPPLVLEPVGE